MTPQTPRVLLAASGSEASRRAAVVAADLASTFDAQLTIVHVVAPVEYRVGRLAPTLPITRQLDDPLTNPVLLEARRAALGPRRQPENDPHRRRPSARDRHHRQRPRRRPPRNREHLPANPECAGGQDTRLGDRPLALSRAAGHRRPAGDATPERRTRPRHLSWVGDSVRGVMPSCRIRVRLSSTPIAETSLPSRTTKM